MDKNMINIQLEEVMFDEAYGFKTAHRIGTNLGYGDKKFSKNYNDRLNAKTQDDMDDATKRHNSSVKKAKNRFCYVER